jgi:hypothetical protein
MLSLSADQRPQARACHQCVDMVGDVLRSSSSSSGFVPPVAPRITHGPTGVEPQPADVGEFKLESTIRWHRRNILHHNNLRVLESVKNLNRAGQRLLQARRAGVGLPVWRLNQSGHQVHRCFCAGKHLEQWRGVEACRRRVDIASAPGRTRAQLVRRQQGSSETPSCGIARTSRWSGGWHLAGVAVAVAEGFEPSDGGYPSHAFEACSLGRSDTPPRHTLPNDGVAIPIAGARRRSPAARRTRRPARHPAPGVGD